jgi:hypothetical protein
MINVLIVATLFSQAGEPREVGIDRTTPTVGVLMHTQQPKHEQFLKALAAQNGGTYRRIH